MMNLSIFSYLTGFARVMFSKTLIQTPPLSLLSFHTIVRKLGHLSTLVSHGPLCVSQRIKCYKDQPLKIYDNYNIFFSMGNAYKTIMIYVSKFRILNTVVTTNTVSSALQKAFQTIKLTKNADELSISKFLFYLLISPQFSTLSFCPSIYP